LLPAISGNTINGLGEAGFRQASPVYWHGPDTIAHGKLQKWLYTQNPDNETIVKARAIREKILGTKIPMTTEGPQQQSAKEWSNELPAFSGTLELRR